MVRVVPGGISDWRGVGRLDLRRHGRSSGADAVTGVERPVLLAVYRGQLLCKNSR